MFFSNPLTHFRWDLIYRLWVYLTLELRDIKSQIILSVTVPTCFRSGHSFGKIWLWISTFILMIIIHGKRKGLLAEVSWEKLWAHSLPTPSLKPMTDRWMSAAGTFIAQSLKQTENQSRGCKPAPLTVCLLSLNSALMALIDYFGFTSWLQLISVASLHSLTCTETTFISQLYLIACTYRCSRMPPGGWLRLVNLPGFKIQNWLLSICKHIEFRAIIPHMMQNPLIT